MTRMNEPHVAFSNDCFNDVQDFVGFWLVSGSRLSNELGFLVHYRLYWFYDM